MKTEIGEKPVSEMIMELNVEMLRLKGMIYDLQVDISMQRKRIDRLMAGRD